MFLHLVGHHMMKAFLRWVKVLVLVELVLTGTLVRTAVDALSMDYYGASCPFAEMIVKNAVEDALRRDPTLSGGLLRMHFHDCFVEGCDGSVLIDSTKDSTAEKDSPANLSLRGYEVIDDAKEEIENRCEGVVSCADIVAMAARDAVFWAGGPYYQIPLGRKDGRRSKIQDTINLPPPTLNSTGLISLFGRRGFTAQEMVALSGGHTLGVARCASFKNRLSKFDSNNDVDPSLSPSYAEELKRTCGRGGDSATVAFDRTRTDFDNDFYDVLTEGEGLLQSDQALYVQGAETRRLVEAYALNQARFFMDFQRAMIKMGRMDVKEGNNGEIRINCRKLN